MSKYSKVKKRKCISCYKNVPIGYLSKTDEGWLCNRCQSVINKTKKVQKSQSKVRSKPKIEFRVCPRCKTNKPIGEFQRNIKLGRRAINFWCRKCHREYSWAYRRRPGQKEKNAAYMRKYMRKYRARTKQANHPDRPEV